MTRSLPLRSSVLALGASLTCLSLAPRALAQATPLPEAVTVGAWTFRPTLEVRVRGEYRRSPFDAGGSVFATSSVFDESPQNTLPRISSTEPRVTNQYFISERARLGIAIDRGPVTAAVSLQDARPWGDTSTMLLAAPGEPLPPSFGPNEAYLDVHTRTGRHIFLRVGRQQVTWGDGRLIGANDWSITARSLDAARFGFAVGDVDVETMAALLAAPGRYLPANATSATAYAEGSGAELYGANVIWHALPWLQPEVTGLARIARNPNPSDLTPSDTFVVDGRITGDRRGFRYALEGAYEGGRVAGFGTIRKLSAFALGANASFETALPGHITFSAEAAYASGDSGQTTGTMQRFDPLLPDEHALLSPMSLVAWSNVIDGGGGIGFRPLEELGFSAAYHYLALAKPGGRWSDAALQPIGAAPTNTARALGHEIDAVIKWLPWRLFEVEAGYGLFVRGSGAEAILKAAGRDAALQHWTYLQLLGRVP